jgi:hypothetical protein
MASSKPELLYGPYQPPVLRRGDRTTRQRPATRNGTDLLAAELGADLRTLKNLCRNDPEALEAMGVRSERGRHNGDTLAAGGP